MVNKQNKNADDLVRLHVFQNQDELVNTLLQAEHWVSDANYYAQHRSYHHQERPSFPTYDDIVNLTPRRDILELIDENPEEYEEFIVEDNPELVFEFYSDIYQDWLKENSYGLDVTDVEVFLRHLEISHPRSFLLRQIMEFENDEVDNLYEHFQDRRIDIYDESHEVFSWILVSDWLANRLEEKGETVLRFYNQEWWGRSTFGQMYSADSVLIAIARDTWGDVQEDEDGSEPS